MEISSQRILNLQKPNFMQITWSLVNFFRIIPNDYTGGGAIHRGCKNLYGSVDTYSTSETYKKLEAINRNILKFDMDIVIIEAIHITYSTSCLTKHIILTESLFFVTMILFQMIENQTIFPCTVSMADTVQDTNAN